MDQSARFAVQDLKAFYTEALAAPDGSHEVDPARDWFWRRTAAARLLFRLAHLLSDDPDEDLRQLGVSGIVPRDGRIQALMDRRGGTVDA